VNSTTPAIMIDSPNNSLEDISILGNSSLPDGILIGSLAAAQGNVLFNISGNISGSGLKNVIHISGNTAPSGASNCPNSSNYVCDLTILGVTNSGGTNTIQDDLINPTQGIKDANLAMYIVGEPVQATSLNVGYSRFTTSASVPTWLVGSIPPANTGSCSVGDLYSCTSSACSSGTIFECIVANNPWLKIQ
jgi:hypothetical protein